MNRVTDFQKTICVPGSSLLPNGIQSAMSSDRDLRSEPHVAKCVRVTVARCRLAFPGRLLIRNGLHNVGCGCGPRYAVIPGLFFKTMNRPFSRRSFENQKLWRTDLPPEIDDILPKADPRSARIDIKAVPTSSATADVDSFSAWLDEELEVLEERFRRYWTRQSLVVVLIAVCDP